MSDASVNFNGIKPGDRVRLVFEVTAKRVESNFLRTKENIYYAYEGEDELVSVEKIAPQLPTEPGWYESEKYPLSEGWAPYELTRDGVWQIGGDKRVKGRRVIEGAMPLHRLGRVNE